MKKILLFIFILLIPFIVKAETNKVYINSISIEETTGKIKEIEQANANGNIINLNVHLLE